MRPIFRNLLVKQAVSKTLERVIETYLERFEEYAIGRHLVKIRPIGTFIFDIDFSCFISCINNGKYSFPSVVDSVPLINVQNER